MGCILDFELLDHVEDEFDSQLTQTDLFVGAITAADSRTLYIYTMQETLLNKLLENIFSKHKKLTYDISIVEDSDWTFYLDTLYPDDFEIQWIKDRNVVEQLKANNDNLQIPREITHWLYFIDNESREAFKRNMNSKVYRVIEEGTLQDDSDFPYQLVIAHTSTVELETIYNYTTELLGQATKVGGDYDGWETPVVKNK